MHLNGKCIEFSRNNFYPMIEGYENITISIDATVMDALKRMDEVRRKMLLVNDGAAFYSIVTIGDIQRAILKGKGMDTPLRDIISREDKVFASKYDQETDIRQKMLTLRCELMPVLDDDYHIVKVYQWNDFFGKEEIGFQRQSLDLPVVIMAGGKGTRLLPLTNMLPKPLIPLGEKTILEEIMDRFERIGSKRFYLSLNYKCEDVENYLARLRHHYNVNYVKEDRPLGTVGSVTLLKGIIHEPFFLSNCDILIDQDMRDVYDFHCSNHNDITIISAVKSINIPYGVIEMENGQMTRLKEKPVVSYNVNTGVYLLQPEMIDEIPEGQFFHITQLIDIVHRKGGKVGCFPISDRSWNDIGEWDGYLKYIGK